MGVPHLPQDVLHTLPLTRHDARRFRGAPRLCCRHLRTPSPRRTRPHQPPPASTRPHMQPHALATFASPVQIICDTCLELLDGDATQLQQDLLTWTPDQFAAAAAVEPGQQRRRPAPGQRRRQIHAP